MSPPGTKLLMEGGQSKSLCPGVSDVNLFRYGERVINLDAKISDRAFDLGMAEQKLHGSQIAGPAVDQSCLCPPKRVGAK
jgi:hypothetical protein